MRQVANFPRSAANSAQGADQFRHERRLKRGGDRRRLPVNVLELADGADSSKKDETVNSQSGRR